MERDQQDKNGKARPRTQFRADGIADSMKEADRWILWKVGERDGAWTKVPCDRNGRPVSVTDEANWLSWTEALEACEYHSYRGPTSPTSEDSSALGIGFVLGQGWVGVDFDKVAQDRVLEDTPDGRFIREWIGRCGTWCEWSPSGTGLHAIYRGAERPEWSANRRQGTPIEVYDAARFFTVTGDAVYSERDANMDRGALAAVCDRWLRKEAVGAVEAPRAADGLLGGLEDASATDWRFVCAALQAGTAPIVVESMLRLKMERENRGDKASRADYIPNTVAKAAATVQASPRGRPLPPAPRILEPKPFERPEYPVDMREPLVDGLFRRGEIVNWIGSSKTGKSWLLHRLIMGLISGTGFPGKRGWFTRQSRVLLVDNELHEETIANRLHSTSGQVQVPGAVCAERLEVLSARGQCMSLDDLEATLEAKGQGYYDLVAVDALYKMIPAGLDENANADMAQLYNQLDRIALKSGAAVLVVHHATKGVQTGKSVMDIGAGAGAIGRATDSHITFLRHKDEGCIVMQAETRSFKRPEPVVLSTLPAWPCLAIDTERDPSELWHPNQKPEE